MEGEIKFFRKRFIGGFNRQDVIDYIANLAQERDRNLALKEKADQEAKDLEATIESLKRERDEALRLASEYKSEVLKAARKTLADFEVSFEGLCAGFDEGFKNICAQLEYAGNIIAILPEALNKTGAAFRGLRGLLDEGKDEPEEGPAGAPANRNHHGYAD